jgi:Spy/CpxP family protein refolding chaperone
LIVAALFAASLPFAAATSALAGPGGHEFHYDGGFGFLHGVTLTVEQKAQVHQLIQASWEQSKPVAQQLRAIRKSIVDQLASTGAIDTAKITGLQQQAAQLSDQLQAQRLNAALQVRALLTPAQLAEAAQVHQQLAALHEQEATLLKRNHNDGTEPQQ